MRNIPVFLLLMAVAFNGLPGTDLLVLCFGSDGHVDVHDLSIPDEEGCCPTHGEKEGCCGHEAGCTSQSCDCLHAPLPGSNDFFHSSTSFIHVLERLILAQGDLISQSFSWITHLLMEIRATGPPLGQFIFMSLSTIVLLI